MVFDYGIGLKKSMFDSRSEEFALFQPRFTIRKNR